MTTFSNNLAELLGQCLQSTSERSVMKVQNRKKVLLVDDDQDFLFQHKVMLEACGFDVFTAEGEVEATRLLADIHPDLAVVDLMMENTDGGFTLCYHLKKKYPNTPVILVTSVNDEAGFNFDAATTDERAWVKADAFLGKPIRFEQLQTEITRLLRE